MFTAPQSKHKNYYDQARFHLTWNLNVMLLFLLSAIAFVFLIIRPSFSINYFMGAVLALVGVIQMKRTQQYKIPAITLTVVGFIVVLSSVFLLKGTPHYIEPFWLINIVLYAYFSLGKRWGLTMLFALMVSISAFFMLIFQESVANVHTYEASRLMMMCVEFLSCMGLMGYIIVQFIKVYNHAETRLTEANNNLLIEKGVVENQNKEKTVLLQEIHHRVKNNLQVIISLLRLQSGMIDNKETQMFFQDATNRIMTMALIHQKMYEGENLYNINIEEYFQELLNHLIDSSGNKDVISTLDIQIKRVGNKTIIPLALILNELITNSLKHAHVPGQELILGIKMSAVGEDEIEFEYFDNGIWKEPNSDKSLGIELIDAFTSQLEGSYTFLIADGRSTYSFKLKQLED